MAQGMSLRACLAGGLAALALTSAHAQSASNGAQLYGTALVSGQKGCSANSCHGPLTQPQNRIAQGSSAANIKTAVSSVAQMRFLAGKLTDSQLNDLAAYIAGQLGTRPSYLQVVATPQPVLSPASVSFAAQALLTTSDTQTVTLSNGSGGSAPLVLGTLSVTAGSDFSLTGGTCKNGNSLPVGASCTLLVSFTPTAPGTRSGELRIVHNGESASSTATLTGTGIGDLPLATVTPSALSFSQTLGGSSGASRVLVGNGSTGTLRLTSLALSGPHAAEFSLDSSGCGAGTTLAGAQSCEVSLRFTPAAAGKREAALLIEHNGQGGSTSLALTGWGNSSAQPGLLIDATRLDLGEQVVGRVGTPRVLSLVNNGAAALNLSALTLAGTRASEFTLGGTCAVGTPVAAQGSCTISVAAAPATLGQRTATLTIASNAPGGEAVVTLAATGVPTPRPALTLSQAALGFGTVTIGGRSAARAVTMSNAGTAALEISSIASASREFELSHDCPTSLAAGARCSINVVYAPSAAAAAEVATILSNAPSSPNQLVLTGVGSTSTLGVLDWTEGSSPISFADTAVGSTSALVTRTLVNRGPGSVTLSSLALAGAAPGSFAIGAGNCAGGTALNVGDSCTVGLRFAPSAGGVATAVLQVTSNGSNPAELVLDGTGSGVGSAQPRLIATPAALDYRHEVLLTGSRSAALTVRIANSGNADSTITSVEASAGFVVQPASGEGACPGVPWTLAPGAYCNVAVIFAPSSAGEVSGTLKVVNGGGLTSEVAMTGSSEAKMTNVGYAGEGAGALGLGWLLLLAVAAASLLRANGFSRHRPKQP
jgi:mono/diheme cytochrome c family protein